jgi:hypothetical protein
MWKTSTRRIINHWRKKSKGYMSKSNLHVQCSNSQNSNDIHHRDWKINSKVHLEANKTTNPKAILTDQKEWYWRCRYTQSHGNESSMVPAQKQTWRAVEQNRGPRYESMQLNPPNFWQRCQKHTMEKRWPLQQMLLGKQDICMQISETRSMSSPVQVSIQSGLRTII